VYKHFMGTVSGHLDGKIVKKIVIKQSGLEVNFAIPVEFKSY